MQFFFAVECRKVNLIGVKIATVTRNEYKKILMFVCSSRLAKISHRAKALVRSSSDATMSKSDEVWSEADFGSASSGDDKLDGAFSFSR